MVAEMITINQKDLKGNPTQRGWYICRYIHASWTHYVDEDYDVEDYRIDRCVPKILYWADNLWLVDPTGYKFIDEKNILDWMPIPDDFATETVRVNM